MISRKIYKHHLAFLCLAVFSQHCCDDETGFITSKEACCGQGPNNGLGLCNRFSNLCPDRSLYAFWDPFHPTEKAGRFIVQQMMIGSSKYMSPMNLSTIMALDSRI